MLIGMLAYAAGTTGFKFKDFLILAVLSTLFWSSLWGIAVYAVGEVFLTILKKYGFLLIIFLIVGMFLAKLWEEENEEKK